ncbi:MAG TPA: DUF4438 domain-containing protein [Streptosporangiaceae bacterium]|nr:DUF4438 domain-containing protein [Streptosporangiaceae bacterium]
MTGLRLVAVNLLGMVEHPGVATPYRVDRDGRSYVPAGDGGIVLGLELGDSAFGLVADHPAPGACLVHPDPASRHALASYACIGNQVVVRTGAAAGAHGVVTGKRGEEGRVIVGLAPGDLARMRPGDEVAVRACGQGLRPPGLPPDVTVMNLDPGLLPRLPVGLPAGAGAGAGGAGAGAGGDKSDDVTVTDAAVTAGVRMIVPSRLAGNGIGRPAVAWDLDLQLLGPGTPGGRDLALGDLVAVADIDARYNMGYRRDWVTVGVVVHGDSPQPGHGPGITPILTGPARALRAVPDAAGHVGLTAAMLQLQ